MLDQSKLLVVEDEAEVGEHVKLTLEEAGYNITLVSSSRDCTEELSNTKDMYDLLLLDLGLPDAEGLETLKALEEMEILPTLPVIVLSGEDDENIIVQALEHGADDYITKPANYSVMLARIRSLLRRTHGDDSEVDIEEAITIDSDAHVARLHGSELHLTGSEFSILAVLVSNAGKVYTRKQLIEYMHGESHKTVERTIDVHVASLREKLGEERNRLVTVRGVGYRFQDLRS